MTLRQWLWMRKYRLTMRIIHHYGWCWPQKGGVEPNHVWCHWCGMRGSKPEDINDPEVRARLEAEMSNKHRQAVEYLQRRTGDRCN